MPEQTTRTLEIFRFDPDRDTEPHFDTFQVSPTKGMTVLEALFSVMEEQDNSLSFRYSCRGAICGSCAMYINGAYRLACETQIGELRKITVRPLPHLPLIKDLVVDMTPFFEKYHRIMPYLKAEGAPPARERLQTPKERKSLDTIIDCILCAACYSACPMVWTHDDYLGPSALNQAYRFVADSRDEARSERLKVVSDEHGIWRCHTIFNCVEACPKKIDTANSIQQLKKQSTAQRLKFWSRKSR